MVLCLWIPAHIHSDKGWSFGNDIISHLYSMHNIKHLTTHMGILYVKDFNYILLDLIRLYQKEQKANWPLHVPSLVLTYNPMPHSITGYQPYELMFGCKAPTVCDTWLG